jgi:apolipoprotein D and lipocalin family protein
MGKTLATMLVVLAAACASAPSKPLETVAKVDLGRYVGRWYEIASFPTWFQKDCVGSTAFYSLREDGDIDVLNQCRKEPGGALDSARGTAWVVDPATHAKLKVRFFWPFSGDYWIIDLGPDYEYAAVGHPSRDYLWILSRTPQMEAALYARILERLREKGYDVGRLVRTRQPM